MGGEHRRRASLAVAAVAIAGLLLPLGGLGASGASAVPANRPPAAPTDPAFVSPARSCGTASAPTQIGGPDVTVSVSQTDPDGGNVDTTFFLHRRADLTKPWQTRTSGMQSEGKRTAQFTGLPDGQFAWRARGKDASAESAGYSPWCYFSVDNAAPAAPAITLPTTSAIVGKAMTAKVTVKPSDGVAFVAFWAGDPSTPVFSGAPPCGERTGTLQILCPDSAGVATAVFAPIDSLSAVNAVAYDAAGNSSGAPTSRELHARTDPAVSFAAGHTWLTQAQSTPLGASIPDKNATSPAALTLGADTLRTLLANPLVPTMPATKPALGFRDPASIVASSWTGGAYISSTPIASGDVDLYRCAGRGGGAVATKALCDRYGFTSQARVGYSWSTAAGAGWPDVVPLTACDVTGMEPGYTPAIAALPGTTCISPRYPRAGKPVASLGYVLRTKPTGPASTRTASPVVKPVSSFTVAAWLKPEGAGGVAVSTVGTSGFWLGATADAWQFCLRPQAPAEQVCASNPRRGNAPWTHVSGVWDAANQDLRLYLNGSIAARAAFSWPAGTPATAMTLNVGAVAPTGTVRARWAGQLADPAVYAGVATASQLGLLDVGNDPAQG